jgi:TPR repeat protein
MGRKKVTGASTIDSKPMTDEEWLNIGKKLYKDAMYQPRNSDKRIELLVQAAEYSHPDACHELCELISMEVYKIPEGSPPGTHFSYICNSADGGYITEQYQFAKDYLERQDVSNNIVMAVKYFELVYQNSLGRPLESYYYSSTCRALAEIYNKGIGIVATKKKTFLWTKRAAYSGSHNHTWALSCYYYHGHGVEKNPIEAYVWALIYKAGDDESEEPYHTEVLRKQLPLNFIEVLEEEADRRFKILYLENRILTDEDVASFVIQYEVPQPIVKDIQTNDAVITTQGATQSIETDETTSNLQVPVQVEKSADYYYKESLNNEKYGLSQALDLLEKAAELGHPEADYRIACFIEYPVFTDEPWDFEIRFSHLKDAIEKGHLGALHLLGELYLTGVWEESDHDSKRYILMAKDYGKAIETFITAANKGFAPSQFKLHEIYEENIIMPKNYQTSFKWLKKAAYNRFEDAYPKLVKAYETGIFQNLEEAYIWASISNTTNATLNDRTAPDRLEKAINNSKRIIELQSEASRRHEIIKERALTEDDVLEFNMLKHLEDENNATPFSTWHIQNAHDVKIILNLGDKNKTMTIEHQKDKATFKFRELFTNNCISLMVKHYQYINEGKEAIRYIEYTVAALKSKRKNHEIVSDFNTRFRELMGHKRDKDFKAFEWIGKAKGTRSLKANIQIEVYT